MQDFKHIKAWQRAHTLAISLHKLTRGFSRAGHAHLKSQLTRAADSIASNIVEGCGADTNKELARYLDIAIKSASETEQHLLSSRDHGLLSLSVWRRLTAEIIEIRKMTYVYRQNILNSDRGRR